MIIQVRGTGGSGKTWVIRQVLDRLRKEKTVEEVYVDGRRKPLYYKTGAVYILGHYEAACGGCDNVGSSVDVYNLTKQILDDDPEALILCEGLLLGEDVVWTSKLPDVQVYYLNTPFDRCIQQIESRRKASNRAQKPLNTEKVKTRGRSIERSRGRLEALGVYCRGASPKQAVRLIRKQINAE